MKDFFKTFIKVFCCGLVWFVVSFILGIILSKFTVFLINDLLFLEGILLIILGVFSSIGGNPIDTSIQGFGQVNAQYIANNNIQIIKEERSKTSDLVKTTISIGLSTLSLIIGGIMCILINFPF